MYLKFSVEGLVFGVDRLGCKVLGLDINAKVQCVCTLNAISWCHIQAGYTSVGLAVEQKHEATVEVLLEAIIAAGMDIDARYEGGGIHSSYFGGRLHAEGQTLLMRASALGLPSTVGKLLSLGANVAVKDKAGNTSVWLAIECGRWKTSSQLGIHHGTALQQKHEAVIEVLLQAMMAAGMDIDAPYEGISEYSIGTGTLRKQGQTLLMHASQTGLTSLVVKLLALGADLSAKDANQKDPIDYADNIVLGGLTVFPNPTGFGGFQVLINNNNIGINAYQVLINNNNDDDKNNHPPAPGRPVCGRRVRRLRSDPACRRLRPAGSGAGLWGGRLRPAGSEHVRRGRLRTLAVRMLDSGRCERVPSAGARLRAWPRCPLAPSNSR